MLEEKETTSSARAINCFFKLRLHGFFELPRWSFFLGPLMQLTEVRLFRWRSWSPVSSICLKAFWIWDKEAPCNSSDELRYENRWKKTSNHHFVRTWPSLWISTIHYISHLKSCFVRFLKAGKVPQKNICTNSQRWMGHIKHQTWDFTDDPRSVGLSTDSTGWPVLRYVAGIKATKAWVAWSTDFRSQKPACWLFLFLFYLFFFLIFLSFFHCFSSFLLPNLPNLLLCGRLRCCWCS